MTIATPCKVQLMPMGTHRTRNGSPPVVILADRAHAERVVAASDAYRGPNRMVIDYDHQTVRAPDVGGRAEAAGWIDKLTVEDDGIWGVVSNWTASAIQAIGDKAYRYVSPFFGHERDGTVTRIFNLGLTNTPNLDLAAVASARPQRPAELQATGGSIGLSFDLAGGAFALASWSGNFTDMTDEERSMASRFGLSDAEYLASKKQMYSAPAPSFLTAEERASCSAFGLTEAEYLSSKQRLAGDSASSRISPQEQVVCSALRVSEAEYLKAQGRGR